jgi:hypothetical protein
MTGPVRAGLNRVLIPLAGGGGGRGGGGGGRGGAGRAGGPPAGPLAVGDYTITVDVGGEKQTVPARVRERIVR